MADRRSRVDKLMAMALQEDSPEEAAVAQAKLAEMGQWPPPPPPPTAVGAPGGSGWRFDATTTTANVGVPWTIFGIRIVVKDPFDG